MISYLLSNGKTGTIRDPAILYRFWYRVINPPVKIKPPTRTF